MAETLNSDILIIGSGPAGWSAAIYAARALRTTRVVSGLQPGGQLTITTEVENYPGFAEIQGPELMDKMRHHAEKMGTIVNEDHIETVDLEGTPFTAIGSNGTRYVANAVIIATGAQAKWLNIESEQAYKGYGVSACATCDGFFFREKPVLVVGGGNTAVEEALFLTNFASSVTLVHRRDSLRAEKILQKRLMDHPKVTIIWDSELEEVLGSDMPKKVSGARIKHVKTGVVTDLDVNGVFIAIGHAPATALFNGKVDMRGNGYIITKPDSTLTNIPGVFAAGDVTDDIFRQAITAAGMGCMAALEAEKYLDGHNA